MSVENKQTEVPSSQFFISEVGLMSKGLELLRSHREIGRKESIENPYFNFSQTEEPLFSRSFRNGFTIETGRVGAFSHQDVATFIQAATQTYVKRGTMGDFPTEESEGQQKLLAEFIGGFTEDRTLTMVSKTLPSGERVIVAGCCVVVGSSDKPVRNLIGRGEASLLTINALDFEASGEYSEFSQTPENQIFAVNRLFRLDNDVCSQYGLSPRESLQAVGESLAGISIARRGLERILERSLLYGLADISDERLLRLVRGYGWRKVTDSVRPTEAILQNILSHHYRYFSQEGKNIFVVVSRAEELDELADRAISKLSKADRRAPFIRDEDGRTEQYSRYLEELNSGKHSPKSFNLEDSKGFEEYARFLDDAQIEFIDTRFQDLISLYTRFHPLDKSFDPRRPELSSSFNSWLSENGVTDLHSQGLRLALPQGYINDKLAWRVVAVLPENLNRQIREASPWKLLDSPDGTVETRKLLYDDVDLVVLGASVGSVIASTMVTSLGINHLTVVDSDIQDGIGTARVDDPKLSHMGKLKVVKLEHSLLEVAPYLKYNIVPENIGPQNVEDIITGVMPDNPNRRLVIVEEVDDTESKDLVRRKIREMYKDSDRVLLISIADIGRTGIKAIIEEPKDPPYAGAALRYTQDYFGSGVSAYEGEEGPAAKALTILTKILTTYGLIAKKDDSELNGDHQIPIELLNALGHLLSGQIKSFEQSGLATRLSGVVASQALLSWLEGHLGVRELKLDLANYFDSRLQDPAFLTQIRESTLAFQDQIGIRVD